MLASPGNCVLLRHPGKDYLKLVVGGSVSAIPIQQFRDHGQAQVSAQFPEKTEIHTFN